MPSAFRIIQESLNNVVWSKCLKRTFVIPNIVSQALHTGKHAKACFEKGLNLSNGKFFLAHFYFARDYAVKVQDKELFLKLADEIITRAPDEIKEVCLINAVMQHKIKKRSNR